MDVQTVLQELAVLGTERTKKMYIQQGAREPVFGVATGAMKPLYRKIKQDQALADQLYATGNYDAMYFAGMIADPKAMTVADFDRWMAGAYFYMISYYIVAATLAETEFAQSVTDRWIADGREPYVSAGYSCYCWLLGNRKDDQFDRGKDRCHVGDSRADHSPKSRSCQVRHEQLRFYRWRLIRSIASGGRAGSPSHRSGGVVHGPEQMPGSAGSGRNPKGGGQGSAGVQTKERQVLALGFF